MDFKYNHVTSFELYLKFFLLLLFLIILGIIPFFIFDEKYVSIFFASSYNPGIKNIPLKDMKISLTFVNIDFLFDNSLLDLKLLNKKFPFSLLDIN